MNILLFGKNGQCGSELRHVLSPLGSLTALDRTRVDYCGDVSNLEGLAQTIAAIKPDVIVNAAAYTAVDKAESEPSLVRLVNARAPEIMAMEARRIGARLVHYSTDYVFDGLGSRPYKENDAACPINVYGHSKKEGEDAIVASGCDYLIFRSSWVYGTLGKNFVKTILNLAATRDTLNVVNDQIGAPISAALLAQYVAWIVAQPLWKSGLFHVTTSGETSWCDYARLIVETARGCGALLKLSPEMINPIASKDYPMAAQRPLNSRLDTSTFQETFGINPPPWQHGVVAMIKQMVGSPETVPAQTGNKTAIFL